MIGRAIGFAALFLSLAGGSAVAQQWKTYTYADDNFAVELPNDPKIVTEKPAGTVLINHQYQIQLKDGGYVIAASKYSAEAKLDIWGEGSMAKLAEAMKGDCQVRDGKSLPFPGGLSFEAMFDKCKDGTVMKIRMYKAGDWLYQLIAAGPPDIGTRPDTAKFQDSFKLVTAAAAPPATSATPTSATAASPAPAGKLTGPAAWKALIGNTITGKFDGELQTEFYEPDGRVKMKYDDNLKSGTWTLRNEKICMTVKGEDEECWGVEVDGNKATFIESDGKRLDYEVLKGNARAL